MRILVVDDHAIVRHGLVRLLTSDGDHQVSQAATGREALDLTRTTHPDLIILDLNLPGMGGLELLRRLVQMDAGKVLILSMHAEPLYARRALDAGAAGYVSKNASPDELIAAMRRVSAGGRYVEAEIAQALALGAGVEALDALNPREIEMMRLLARGSRVTAIRVGVECRTALLRLSCTRR